MAEGNKGGFFSFVVLFFKIAVGNTPEMTLEEALAKNNNLGGACVLLHCVRLL